MTGTRAHYNKFSVVLATSVAEEGLDFPVRISLASGYTVLTTLDL